MGYEKAYVSVTTALTNMQLSYIDLMLIHWPGVKGKPLTSESHRIKRFETYKELLRGKIFFMKEFLIILISTLSIISKK